MTLRKSPARVDLERGWTDGFSPASARLMTPISAGYRGLLEARDWLYARGVLKSRRLDCPVVSIGNVTVGGTGKTPAVMLAVETLIALGHRPAVVSRGYGRRSSGVQVVADTAMIRLEPEESGDEPFVLARRLPRVPVVVGANRWEAARVAVTRFGATAIVLDDGFQHKTLVKDLEIVMVRATRPWGNGRLFPAGPLREPLAALARADLVVVTGTSDAGDAREVRDAVAAHGHRVPVLPARYVVTECWDASRMEPLDLGRLRGARVVGFAGIGNPDGFVRTLGEVGLDVADFVAFGDHHWYTVSEIEALVARATEVGADAVVTTEKDWVRLRRLRLPVIAPVWVVGVRLVFVDGEAEWRAALVRVCETA